MLESLPPHVEVVVAATGRSLGEISEAAAAGIKIIGHNYVQEAEAAFDEIGSALKWHFIGRLQKNKAGRAVRLFDMIETVDSGPLATAISRKCAEIGKVMPVLIEVNSGREAQKSGVLPEAAAGLAREIAAYPNLRLSGVMTVGPLLDNPEASRPCFGLTRQVFEDISSLGLPGAEMKYLSMGMTDTYRIAIEEGANIIRVGTLIFGARPG